MATLAEELRDERRNLHYSDVIVTVEDKDFPCHRVLLAIRSKFFDRAFQTEMKEKIEGRIEVKGISAETFEILLQYVYHDDDILNKESVFDILLAANQLQIESLLLKGRQFLGTILCVENCGHVFRISQIQNWEDLEKSAWSLLEKNFDKVELTELDVLTNEDMKRLVESDKLETRSEDLVLGKVLQWISLGAWDDPDNKNPDDTGRAKYLTQLLKASKHYLISSNFLWGTLNTNRFVQCDPECRELVQKISCHKMQLDTHQHGCLRAELHRTTDKVQNTRLTMFKNNLQVHSITQEGTSKEANFRFPMQELNFSGGAFYNGTTYFELSQEEKIYIYEYDPLQQKVSCCNESSNLQGNITSALLPVEDSLVALRTSGINSGNHILECIKLPCKSSYCWVSRGCPALRGLEVESVTNIGSKLVIFWKSANHGSLTIECFDLDHQKSYILEDQVSPSMSLKAFKKGDQVFALQSDGMLWRVHAIEHPPYVKLVQLKQLWTGEEELQSVMLVLDTLVISRTTPVSDEKKLQWEHKSIDSIFTNTAIRNITGKAINIFHTVLGKEVM